MLDSLKAGNQVNRLVGSVCLDVADLKTEARMVVMGSGKGNGFVGKIDAVNVRCLPLADQQVRTCAKATGYIQNALAAREARCKDVALYVVVLNTVIDLARDPAFSRKLHYWLAILRMEHDMACFRICASVE